MPRPVPPRRPPLSPRPGGIPAFLAGVTLMALMGSADIFLLLSGCNSRAGSVPATGTPAPALTTYHLRAADLPKPNATPSAVNPARVVARSEGDFLTLPPGFEAFEAAGGFRM